MGPASNFTPSQTHLPTILFLFLFLLSFFLLLHYTMILSSSLLFSSSFFFTLILLLASFFLYFFFTPASLSFFHSFFSLFFSLRFLYSFLQHSVNQKKEGPLRQWWQRPNNKIRASIWICDFLFRSSWDVLFGIGVCCLEFWVL